MNKEFVPYDIALPLKELGFNENCLGCYHKPEQNLGDGLCLDAHKNEYSSEWTFSAPLFQQVFRWFRDKQYDSEIIPYNLTHSEAKLLNIKKEKKYVISINGEELPEGLDINMFYSTYEEAELACLRKLIEIVKENEK